MFFTCYVVGLAIFSTSVYAREKPVDQELAASLYDNGARHMEIMNLKEVNLKGKI
jgi:hypothetical protein